MTTQTLTLTLTLTDPHDDLPLVSGRRYVQRTCRSYYSVFAYVDLIIR